MTTPRNIGALSKSAGATSTTHAKPKTFAQYVKAPGVLNSIEQTLGSAAKRETFVSSLISAVSTNPSLKDCEPNSIISSALLGDSLKLPPSPQLGYFYMVPYKVKAKKADDGSWIPEHKEAQFQLGYKGYIQLAQRSGFFRRINVTSVKEGELISWDPFDEELRYKLIPDRSQAKTVGYYAFFELTNGFRKAIYMTYEEMLNHADKYSKAFSKEAFKKVQNNEIPQEDMWRFSSFWYKDFDTMAYKTMLRQLISKWAPMSVDMQKGIEKDVAGSEVVEADYTEIIDFNQAQPEPEPAQIEHDEVGNFDTQQILNAEGKAKEPEPLKINADGEVL